MIEEIAVELQEKNYNQKNPKNSESPNSQTLKPFLSKLGIRYLALINKQGRLKEEVVVSANDFHLSSEKKEMFFMTFRLQASMQNDFDDELGPVWYNLVERKNVKFLSMPTYPDNYGDLIFATMRKGTDHSIVIKNIGFLSYCLEKEELLVTNVGINHGREGMTK